MFRRIFGAALGAGIGVGLIVALLQHVTLVPMILTAETYESGAAHEHSLLAPSSGTGATLSPRRTMPLSRRPRARFRLGTRS